MACTVLYIPPARAIGVSKAARANIRDCVLQTTSFFFFFFFCPSLSTAPDKKTEIPAQGSQSTQVQHFLALEEVEAAPAQASDRGRFTLASQAPPPPPPRLLFCVREKDTAARTLQRNRSLQHLREAAQRGSFETEDLGTRAARVCRS